MIHFGLEHRRGCIGISCQQKELVASPLTRENLLFLILLLLLCSMKIAMVWSGWDLEKQTDILLL